LVKIAGQYEEVLRQAADDGHKDFSS
jgi:hypothetical protein